ncbi:hypothetical protein GCM10009096_00590 [Parasphingorhabdus litoris]|uniref:Uncharacterized protein n=1 Tax=Parasphingorhabdus litoris TaxID=394733 RepID=A0ABN0ZZT0_9SPHN|nr:hypothetical protein [Parasphingorhabdus litoris]
MKIFYSMILLFLISISVTADANTVGGKIVHVGSVNETIVFRIVGGTDTNRPACATTLRYAVHKDSVHASLILTAFATGKDLGTVSGLGTCSLWGNAEDLRFIEICPATGCS